MSEEQAEYKVDQEDPIVDKDGKEIGVLRHVMAAPLPPQRDKLFAALAEAQKKISNAEQDASADVRMKAGGTYSYTYATLASIMDAVRGPLAENGLSIIQLTADPGEGKLGIRTILAHESGQSISDIITMAPDSWTPQAVGSCRTYMRRYAVLAIIGIAGAMDDDAEAASPDPDQYKRIDKMQMNEILVLANSLFGEREDAVIDRMLGKLFDGIAISELPAENYDQVIGLLKNQSTREIAAAEKKDKKPEAKKDEKPAAEKK